MNLVRTLFGVVFCMFLAVAQAQWQWVDKDGRKVFSDRAPPADVPQKNILSQPSASARNAVARPAAPDQAASAAASAASADKAPALAVPKLASVDKDLAERKKQADAAAAAKAQAETERVNKIKAENCERARAGKAMMDSGVRVSITNSKGEREVIDDAGRAAEAKRLQAVIGTNCN